MLLLTFNDLCSPCGSTAVSWYLCHVVAMRWLCAGMASQVAAETECGTHCGTCCGTQRERLWDRLRNTPRDTLRETLRDTVRDAVPGHNARTQCQDGLRDGRSGTQVQKRGDRRARNAMFRKSVGSTRGGHRFFRDRKIVAPLSHGFGVFSECRVSCAAVCYFLGGPKIA